MAEDLATIVSLAGTAGNTINTVEATKRQGDVYNAAMALQKKNQAASTPAAIAAGTAALEKPLSGDLTSNISREVAAMMAERGLLGAGGLYQDALATSLAPYYLQQQTQAQDAYFKGLGIPIATGFPNVPSPSGSANPLASIQAWLQQQALAKQQAAAAQSAYTGETGVTQGPADPSLVSEATPTDFNP